MKRMLSGSFLFLLSSLLLLPTAVQAVDGSTIGDIVFSEDVSITPPKDPTDPSKPGDPADTDNQATQNQGPLSFDVAPVTFDFGPATIAVTQKVYTAQDTTSVPYQFIQVTDNRTDDSGWTIMANRSEFKTAGPNAEELTGSELLIPTGTVKNEETQGGTHAGLAGVEAKMLAGVGNDYTVFKDGEAGNFAKLSSTKYWEGSDVTLTVPAMTAKAGNYTATINWTLAGLP